METYLKQPWATIFDKFLVFLQSMANFGKGFFVNPISTYLGFFPDADTPLPILNYTAFELTLSVGVTLWIGITLWKWIKDIVL